ncbi:NAD(P)H-dependent flavin oxidoreductase YrpB [Pseudomonas syringae pv. actinidiae]|uniref:NAD(P)H-dependent flavin oxidoreductase YrpB n=1 Tax=Pseudomonas syringae pv. actinidiae TaxID=103796 RepID=A0AAN4Q1A3_PSESF|nr:NAD(P)H-dependent flavin oxidoreductase YrpB [Pseudomonas syringae pv. actinidiae]
MRLTLGRCCRICSTNSPLSNSPLKCRQSSVASLARASAPDSSISVARAGTQVNLVIRWVWMKFMSSNGSLIRSGKITVGTPLSRPSNISAMPSTKPIGVLSMKTSEGLLSSWHRDHCRRVRMASSCNRTPLGVPVLPEVYINTAGCRASGEQLAVEPRSSTDIASTATTRISPGTLLRIDSDTISSCACD